MVRPIKSSGKGWSVLGKVLLSDGDAVGEPCRPPSKRANSDDGMITKWRNCHVHNGRVSPGVDDISCVDVLLAPRRIVTEYDKLHSFQAVGEIAHWPMKILGSWSRPAVTLVSWICVIFSSNVDHDSHELCASPRLRGLLLQPAACSLHDARFEREVGSKFFFHMTEILVGREDRVDCYVTVR